MDAKQIKVSGIVQGVGFRPFVFNLAARHQVNGWVRNTGEGVQLIAEGESINLNSFIKDLTAEAPPLAHIESIQIDSITVTGYTDFAIQDSGVRSTAVQPVSPDVALCGECERELFDPTNHRYLYPFINCTNCGPRFTIITDLPYDRPQTTMAKFAMCLTCQSEYNNPRERRFHAQPIACETCGPSLELIDPSHPSSVATNQAAILKTRRALREGKIVAIKGLGGFHLACEATNAQTVRTLRERKGRNDKPFALMVNDVTTANTLCHISANELALLTSREKPIVLLKKKEQTFLNEIAPNLDTLGIMLPYSPLHHLLLNQTDLVLASEPAPKFLVMTSGNLSEEPIAITNIEAQERLASLADLLLIHNRDIYQRCDDSVIKKIPKHPPLFLRRARGYAPYPIHINQPLPHLLAVGGELKNTFCVARDRHAFLSQHIGDMENVETLHSFEHSAQLLMRLFRVEPTIVAHDLHPDYLSTHYAQKLSQRKIGVQHHHAHIAACLADNQLPNQPVIGLAFDGTGYGTDGHIWGSEVLIADYESFTRFAHLEYLPLPGGDTATRHPWRIALGYLTALGLTTDALPFIRMVEPRAAEIVRKQILQKINSPLTASMGRLFDAVAVLAGGKISVSYEAQAAIELESAAAQINVDKGGYEFAVSDGIIGVGDVLSQILQDVERGESYAVIGNKFHRAVTRMAHKVCCEARQATGIKQVALSGGVWQNVLLLAQTCELLRNDGFVVFTHQQTPANDGGLALGQALIAAHQN